MNPVICFLDRKTLRDDIVVRRPAFSHSWSEYPSSEQDEVTDRLKNAEIAITNKVAITRPVIEACHQLKFIAVAATGIDLIDIDACKAAGVSVSNIRNYALHTVPEHVIGMILNLRRKTIRYRSEVIKGRWQQEKNFCFFDEPILDIHGATLGIIGFGALGQATAKLAYSLGMKVQFSSRTPHTSPYANEVDIDTLIQSSDVISLHCPLTPETHHLVNQDFLKKMKPDAILINTARGAVVDEAALASAILNQEISGAAVDVLPKEPPEAGSPLFSIAEHTNLILTPHIAWASQQAMQGLADQLIDNIEAYHAGQPVNLVT